MEKNSVITWEGMKTSQRADSFPRCKTWKIYLSIYLRSFSRTIPPSGDSSRNSSAATAEKSSTLWIWGFTVEIEISECSNAAKRAKIESWNCRKNLRKFLNPRRRFESFKNPSSRLSKMSPKKAKLYPSAHRRWRRTAAANYMYLTRVIRRLKGRPRPLRSPKSTPSSAVWSPPRAATSGKLTGNRPPKPPSNTKSPVFVTARESAVGTKATISNSWLYSAEASTSNFVTIPNAKTSNPAIDVCRGTFSLG